MWIHVSKQNSGTKIFDVDTNSVKIIKSSVTEWCVYTNRIVHDLFEYEI